ncbi:MAG: carboxylesterase/lipase family protein [Christensenella sp.]|nr:carboxylesterase/lipase family protein [Christensenella sp.]
MERITLHTRSGAVCGTVRKNTWLFRGIPYAAPPVGALRFRHAQPHPGWEGVLDASNYGKWCPQNGTSGWFADEDCLTLNIWTPQGGAKKKAVLFYVPGGSFCRGSGAESRYEGTRLAREGDVVVVTINYRLGALGCLDFSFLGEEFEPNCGMSDIVAALRWVYENIEAFGGDPHNITAIGQSAGANAVSALITMPSAKPYIAKAIMMSGCPVWMHTRQEAQNVAQRFLEYAGIDNARELKDASARRLVRGQKGFMRRSGQSEYTFTIVIDGALVPDFPIPSAANGAAGEIPLLIGNTRDEMSFVCSKILSFFIPIKEIALSILSREPKELKDKILDGYRKYGARREARFVTDQAFRLSSDWFAQGMAQRSNVWAYSFEYATAIMKMTRLGACHSSDIPYLFGTYGALSSIFMFCLPARRVIRRIAAEMRSDFTGFAKRGYLSWEKCSGNAVPAKCYDRKTSIRSLIDDGIKLVYDKSRFKKQSFRSVY